MTSALIGHTGFVGSNLLAQGHFDELYNSNNIEDIRGRTFDRVVCAGAPGTKWIANSQPEADLAQIKRLINNLIEVEAETFTLISTVDVLSDEPYGYNRLRLENTVRGVFSNHRIVRLPALFGSGLKKNPLYDLMHEYRLDHLHPDSRYQWYPIRRLSSDLDAIEADDRAVTTLATEPIATWELVERFFPDLKPNNNPVGPPVSYDIRPYYMSRDEVLDEMEAFLNEQMERAA